MAAASNRRLSAAVFPFVLTAFLCGCTLVPQPLSDDERKAEAISDLTAIFGSQEPLRGPLTLDHAFARALAYNLDQRSKLMETAIAQNDVDLSRLDLLPKLVAGAGYTARNNVDASSSVSILTNRQSLEPSTSSDRERRSDDLTLSWNILDFGVSYINARQQANRTLVVEEQRRKVVQTLFQDVRRAFWRAAAAQRLRAELREAIGEADAALKSSRSAESERLRSPIDALRYQRTMLELLRQLETTEELLQISKTELAALINLPPGSRFTLALPHAMRVERIRMPVRQMEEMALLRNPDILELSYQARISAEESRKILLKLLPGINLNTGPQYDSNSYYVNRDWVSLTARASFMLNNLLAAPSQLDRANNTAALADLRRQAITLAVLARLHIAYEQYLAASKDYQRAADGADVDRRLLDQIANRAASDSQSELEKVSAQVNAVNSELRSYQAYAEMQAALGRIYAALGVDPVPLDPKSLNLSDLSAKIRQQASDWRGVRFPAVADRPAPVAPQADEQVPDQPVTVANTTPSEQNVTETTR
jgi:outer membrane protein TolC